VQSIKIKKSSSPNALVALKDQNVPQPPPSEVSSSFLAVKCGMVCCSQVALRSSSILPRCMYCRCIRLPGQRAFFNCMQTGVALRTSGKRAPLT
jgi:hypothetical protein